MQKRPASLRETGLCSCVRISAIASLTSDESLLIAFFRTLAIAQFFCAIGRPAGNQQTDATVNRNPWRLRHVSPHQKARRQMWSARSACLTASANCGFVNSWRLHHLSDWCHPRSQVSIPTAPAAPRRFMRDSRVLRNSQAASAGFRFQRPNRNRPQPSHERTRSPAISTPLPTVVAANITNTEMTATGTLRSGKLATSPTPAKATTGIPAPARPSDQHFLLIRSTFPNPFGPASSVAPQAATNRVAPPGFGPVCRALIAG